MCYVLHSIMDHITSLPPKVNGNIQGYLDVKIKNIEWAQNHSHSVKIKVLWWGQENAVEIFKINSHNDKVLQTYEIRTSYKLFNAYLLNSESLTLSVVDDKTNSLLGVCKVVNLSLISNELPYESSYPIKNSLEYVIGNLHLCFRLCMVSSRLHFLQRNKNVMKTNELKSADEFALRNLDGIDTSMNLNEHIDTKLKLDDNCVSNKFLETIFQQGQQLRKTLIETILENDSSNKSVYNVEPLSKNVITNPSRTELKSSYSELFNYLTGGNLNETEEHRVLETIRNTSPTNSIIALASDFYQETDKENTKHQKHNILVESDSRESEDSSEILHKDIALLKIVDSIKIYIHSLKLNSAGWKKAKFSGSFYTLRLPTFYIEYNIPQSLIGKLAQSKYAGNSNFVDVRFCSKQISNKTTKDILFKQYSLHNISNLHLTDLKSIHIEFRVRSRSLNQKGSIQIGLAKCSLDELNQTSNFTSDQEIVLIDNIKPLTLGSVKLRIQLGCDRIHFGKDFIDAVYLSKNNRKLSHSDSMTKYCEEIDKSSGIKIINKDIKLRKEKPALISNSNRYVRETNGEDVTQLYKLRNVNTLELLQGFIYIPQIIFEPEIEKGYVYLVCRAFWREDSTVSKICHHTQRAIFNFRELMPILYNDDFLLRTKNNFLIIEVWHTTNDSKILIGICKLPLHNFFVAYRDRSITHHLVKRKFPVVGFDGWEFVVDPLSDVKCGKLQALVAVGTESQIHLLESTRLGDSVTVSSSQLLLPSDTGSNPTVNFNNKTGIDNRKIIKEYTAHNKCYSTTSTQTDLIGDQVEPIEDNLLSSSRSQTYANKEIQCSETTSQSIQTKISLINSDIIYETGLKMSGSENQPNNNSNVENVNKKDLFESFIQSLTARLPTQSDTPRLTLNDSTPVEISKTSDKIHENIDGKKLISCENVCETKSKKKCSFSGGTDSSEMTPRIRNTTDLLESLQNALSSVAPVPDLNRITPTETLNHCSNSLITETSYGRNPTSNRKDMHNQRLFKVHIVIENAMQLSVRRRRTKHKSKYTKRCEPSAPSTYVSFEPTPDDILFTHVVSKSFAPCWNEHFETYVPINFLFDDQKRLIFKVWNKMTNDVNVPNPVIDSVIGFAAVDLTVLPAGLPSIQGWFNIVDFSSRCNGQIKINVAPLENLSSIIACPSRKTPSIPDNKIMNTIECPSTSLLGNALKRKFTELDEITERLKQRLLNITNDDSDDLKDDFMTEFEHDLNTKCDELDESEFFQLQANLNTKTTEDDNDTSKSIEKQQNCYSDVLNLHIVTNDDIENARISEKNGEAQNSSDYRDVVSQFNFDLEKNKLQLDSFFQKLQASIFDQHISDKNNVDSDVQSVVLSDNMSEESCILNKNGQKTDEHSMHSDNVNNIDKYKYKSELLWLRQAPEGAGNTSEDNNLIKDK